MKKQLLREAREDFLQTQNAEEARKRFEPKYKQKKIATIEQRLIQKVCDLNPCLANFSNKVDNEYLRKFATSFPKIEKQNLVFIGSTGSGKTWAAATLANALIGKGHVVLYLTTDMLMRRFKNLAFEKNMLAIDDLLECDLLIIDDLGTEPSINNVSEENLYTVINERLLYKRPIIFSSNLSTNELTERYDQRLVSRILSNLTSKIIDFGKTDKRFENKKTSPAKKPSGK